MPSQWYSDDMAIVYVVFQRKGGVGKSDLAKNLPAALVELGKSVVVVDLDAQGSVTERAGFIPKKMSPTIYDVIEARLSGADAPTIIDTLCKSPIGFDLVPANESLTQAEMAIAQDSSNPELIASIIEPLRSQYDYVFIDCRPGLDLLVTYALVAADRAILPTEPKNEGWRALGESIKAATNTQKSLNPSLRISGIVFTKVELHLRQTKQFLEHAHSSYDGIVPIYKAMIRKREIVSLSDMNKESILEFSPQSDVAQAYRDLAREVVNDV